MKPPCGEGHGDRIAVARGPVPLHYNALVLLEAEAIPYEPALLRGERLLVLAPHPDDEVIGCGGLVAQHLREGRRVRIVVATDGGEAGTAEIREEETLRGVERLGAAEVEFLRYPDRGLTDEAAEPIRDQLLAFRPDLILAPSPIEIHPDHLALSRLFCELIQRDATIFADLAVARVAFYEVGQTLRPNTIVDISDVAELKFSAITEHASQLVLRDYVGYTRGLNAYRAMTLPAGCRFAEAYFVVDLPSLRTTAFSDLRNRTSAPSQLAISTEERVPISVIIRTRNRPALLREAIDSVVTSGYPCEIVVVNDGGSPVGEIVASPESRLKLVEHEVSRGRAEAANAGVRAASHSFITFLDDDDLQYPEHLVTLSRATASGHAAWYSDAVSVFLRPAASGEWETRSRLRLFATDYDRELLLLDNYIPLPALLVPRETFLSLDGFDPSFDLFEDWDFLIRLSQRGALLRLPRVTCEIRHFEGGSSVILAAPEGSERFREAKLQVWRKHAALMDHQLLANVFERQKGRANDLFSQLVEAKGQTADAQREITRATRQNVEAQNTINGYGLEVRELRGSIAALHSLATDLTSRLSEKAAEISRMSDELEAARDANRAASATIDGLRVEIERLNGLLDMIYRSRTWKVHTMLEKARGRG